MSTPTLTTPKSRTSHHSPENVTFTMTRHSAGKLWFDFEIASKSKPGTYHRGSVCHDGTGCFCNCGSARCTLCRQGEAVVREWHRRQWRGLPLADLVRFDHACTQALYGDDLFTRTGQCGTLSSAEWLEWDACADCLAERYAKIFGPAGKGRAA